jgi:hypothetical protein
VWRQLAALLGWAIFLILILAVCALLAPIVAPS